MSTWVQYLIDTHKNRPANDKRIDEHIAADISEFCETTGLAYDGEDFRNSSRVSFYRATKERVLYRVDADVQHDPDDISMAFLRPEFERILGCRKPNPASNAFPAARLHEEAQP